jgi:hypothetical protein
LKKRLKAVDLFFEVNASWQEQNCGLTGEKEGER